MDLELKELPPCDCVKMWGPSADRLSVREKIDLLSLTGGVPKYVEEVRPELTADENIRKLCFLPRGFLFKEFDDMFSSVFGQRVKSRGSILRLLMSGPKTAAELAESEGGESSGNYTKVLRDLQLAGFVSGDGGLKECQIDLLIQTERTLFVVEIKRCKEIDHSIISEVEDKVKSLKYDHRQSVRTALVYDGDLVASVPASRYFDFLISAEELFGLKGQGR